MDKLIEQIKSISHVETVEEIHKGFSHDQKYIINQQYILRVFSTENIDERKNEFLSIEKCSKLSRFVPKALEFGVADDQAYMLLEYLPGVDGEDGLNALSEEEQYLAGYQAGKELYKIHQIPAPSSTNWFDIKKKKSDRYLAALSKVTFDETLKELLQDYIHKNEHLMEGRPSTLQHDDFHPANLLIHENQFSGIIDFQRVDFGDPLHDLHKLGFFSKHVSIPFTRGTIRGYFNNQIPESFWELYGLYSAMHVVSAIVWGERFEEKQSKFLKERALEVIADHDYFKRAKPIWAEGI